VIAPGTIDDSPFQLDAVLPVMLRTPYSLVRPAAGLRRDSERKAAMEWAVSNRF
jgi:hypothetical protein